MILDNYVVYKSKSTEQAVGPSGGAEVKFHFLPSHRLNDTRVEWE